MKWIKYYGIAIALMLMASYVFKEHTNITPYSIFPVIYILMNLALILDIRVLDPLNNKLGDIRYSKRRDDIIRSSDDENYIGETDFIFENDKSNMTRNLPKHFADYFLYVIPVYFPFLIFFSNTAKCLSLLFILMPFNAIFVQRVRVWCKIRKHEKARHERIQKELEEQKKKEELGIFK